MKFDGLTLLVVVQTFVNTNISKFSRCEPVTVIVKPWLMDLQLTAKTILIKFNNPTSLPIWKCSRNNISEFRIYGASKKIVQFRMFDLEIEDRLNIAWKAHFFHRYKFAKKPILRSLAICSQIIFMMSVRPFIRRPTSTWYLGLDSMLESC